MKFKQEEPMVIKGSAMAQPGVAASTGVSAVMRVMVGSADSGVDQGLAVATAAHPQPIHALVSVAQGQGVPAHQPSAMVFNGAIESWMPLPREYDSLRLLPDAGLLLVGTNDLGWIVYDWIPGP